MLTEGPQMVRKRWRNQSQWETGVFWLKATYHMVTCIIFVYWF